MTVVFVMTAWYGFNQISPEVCITAAPTDILQLVVTAIAIHHCNGSIPDALQKIGGISPCSGLRIVVKNDRREHIFA